MEEPYQIPRTDESEEVLSGLGSNPDERFEPEDSRYAPGSGMRGNTHNFGGNQLVKRIEEVHA